MLFATLKKVNKLVSVKSGGQIAHANVDVQFKCNMSLYI